MSAPKFPLPFCIEASDSSRNFQMVVSHLARGPFFRQSPLFFSLPLDLYSESECVLPMVAQSEKLRTTVQALVPGTQEERNGLKMALFLITFRRSFSVITTSTGMHTRGRQKSTRPDEGVLGQTEKRKERSGKTRAQQESGVQDGRDLLRSGKRTRDEERERKRETARQQRYTVAE